ncbi:MAG: NAD(P)/FAD-dependent oxidoreductase [Croceivirga sp.]
MNCSERHSEVHPKIISNSKAKAPKKFGASFFILICDSCEGRNAFSTFIPMVVDYIIVGLGLAGISFCEQLEQHDKTFTVISDDSEQASLVAGGLYNPVILKRFTMAWKADVQMQMAMPFYVALEEKLGVKLDYKIPVYRRLVSNEEQNNWFEACDRARLQEFMSTTIVQNTNPSIDAPFGLGKVMHTGRVDTRMLIERYGSYLRARQKLKKGPFYFDSLTVEEDGFRYKDIQAKHIVFAEGFGLKRNPFFSYLPLNGTKGELLTIHAPSLKEESVIKSAVFIIPLGEDLYRIGATYKWKDKTNTPTLASKEELLTKLKTFLKGDFEVVKHVAGVRPTVADRRPLVGRHPKHKNLYALNGFGSRGVLIAPYASQQLYQHIEHGKAIDEDMDIERFEKKYY